MNLSIEAQVAIGFGIVAFGVFLFLTRSVYRRLPKRMKQLRNQQKWSELQKLCKNKETWPDAVSAADKLLDDILKRKLFKGKSMGERIVSAQRSLSDNDAVWFAHNLAKKTKEDDAPQLKEAEVKKALLGFRQALRDLGALQHGNK
jgi:hypothetical protein